MSDIYWQEGAVSRISKERRNGHKPCIVWFTGLSGAGKSTIASALEYRLFLMGCSTTVLDGDNVRHGLCGDLGFTEADRVENVRRVSEVGKLMMMSGHIVLVSLISPYRDGRERARALVEPREFFEVHVKASLHSCEHRDPKGLYKKARDGEIKGFTGISSPYEAPVTPELLIDTEITTVDQALMQVLRMLSDSGIIHGLNTARDVNQTREAI